MSDSVESLQEKCRTLEAECHSLLQRSIQSEQKHSDAASERDRLKSSAGELKEEKQQLENQVRSLKAENEELTSQLAAQVEAAGGDLDIVATLEKEKASARRANELRMELEGNFAELSVQFETLQGEHETLKIDNKQKTKDLEAALTHIESLERNVEALEKAAAQAIEDKESIAEVLTGVKKEFAKEKKAHDKCKDDLRRSQNSLQDLRDEMEKNLAASDKLRRDYDALKKKSVVWKKQAEHARDLEVRNEQLVAQYAFSQKELADARREIGRLQAQLLAVEEEERKRAASSISPKTLQFLRDQLAEANEKLKTLRLKERTWGDQRTALEAQVKRLRFELQRKNPSQLRLMEMEVQNELLLGMVQTSHSPPRQPKPSSIPKAAPRKDQPPRKLPPIAADQGPSPSPKTASDTPTSGSAVSAARKARSKAATPPPSSNASEAGGDRTPAADQAPTPRRPHSASEAAAAAATSSSPPPVAAEAEGVADDADGSAPSHSRTSSARSSVASKKGSDSGGDATAKNSARQSASATESAAAADDENYSDDDDADAAEEEAGADGSDADAATSAGDAESAAAADDADPAEE